MHNYLISKTNSGLKEVYENNDKVLISDTALRSLIPPNIKKMSDKYKEMCGCEICIMAKSHQSDLNAYRLYMLKRMQKSKVDTNTTGLYKYAVYRNNKHLHEKPKDALQCIQCPPLDGFSVPQMKCILRKCSVCPKYRTITYKEGLTNLDPMIQFHTYEPVTRCSIHGPIPTNSNACLKCSNNTNISIKGSISQRKLMILKRTSLKKFMKEHYLPILEKYALHINFVILLGKNEVGKTRRLSLQPGDVETIRDYAERLSFEYNQEIMSTNFGNSTSISMEGVCARFFQKKIVESYTTQLLLNFDVNNDTIAHFHSHLSDSQIQNACSTHQHMIVLIEELKKMWFLLTVETYIAIQMVVTSNIDVQMQFIIYLFF